MDRTVRALTDLAAVDDQLSGRGALMDGLVLALEERRVALRKAIPGVFLAVYDALGLVGRRPVVVPVRGAHCGGCYLRLPPQLDSSIRRRQSLCPCPHCRRLLYSSARSEDGENMDESRHEFGGHHARNRGASKRVRRIPGRPPGRQEPHAAKRRADSPPRGRDAQRIGKTRQTSERRGNPGSADTRPAKAKPVKR
jgi:hypothetical protein